MNRRPVAETLEDLEFLNASGTGASDAADRTGFATPHALEKWLERHHRYDLWLAMKHRDPEGEHHQTTEKREGRRLMSVPASECFEELLDSGDASTRTRTRTRAAKARALLADLRVILDEEAREDAQRAEARAEVERLTRELAEAKARLRGGSPVTLDVDSSVTAAELRAWARDNGVECPPVGRVPAAVRDAYEAAQVGDDLRVMTTTT